MAQGIPQSTQGYPSATMARDPSGPTDLPTRSWWAILKRTVKEFQDDNLTDWAAALTYYGIMSLFPMMVALIAVLGVFGQESSVNVLLDSFREAGISNVAASRPRHQLMAVKAPVIDAYYESRAAKLPLASATSYVCENWSGR